jgi:hypothetical protein
MSTKQVNPAMASYLKTLTQLENGSGGKSYREDQRPLDIKLRPGEVYAVITPDDDRFYRTVMVKENPFTTGFNFLVSNPVQGSVPPQMKVVAQHALFRQMREMNAFQNLEAFPYKGNLRDANSSSGDGLVTQQHKNLQKRNGQ